MATRQGMEQERLARVAERERTSGSTSSSNPSSPAASSAFKPNDTSKPKSMTLSDLKGSSSGGKGGAKKGGEGFGRGQGVEVLSAYDVASKGITLKLHRHLGEDDFYEDASIGWYMGRVGEGLDGVYLSGAGDGEIRRLMEDDKISKAFVTTPPTNQVTVEFPSGGLPRSTTTVKIERARGVRIVDLYEGMIAFVGNASSVEDEEGDEIDLTEVFGEFEVLSFYEPKKGSVKLKAVLQD
ncbi:hypothetical protein BDY24DRAFT_58549 [Mrakia frigida]|uniref:uncharacterized protein n=1 Tax=Mrakia frigida TaxID=29902 RepID=UPI003FCC1291